MVRHYFIEIQSAFRMRDIRLSAPCLDERLGRVRKSSDVKAERAWNK